MHTFRKKIDRLMQPASEYILKPNSPILKEMIGQKILDIGFFVSSSWSKAENEESYIKNGGINFNSLVDFFLLKLEKQNLTFINQNYYPDPTLYYHPNLTVEELYRLETIHFYNDDYPKELGRSGGPILFLASEYPQYSNDIIDRMIGNTIIAIDLYRIIRTEHTIYPQYRYCIMKLYFEDGSTRLLGKRFLEPEEASNHIELRDGDSINKKLIQRVYEIRKDKKLDFELRLGERKYRMSKKTVDNENK